MYRCVCVCVSGKQTAGKSVPIEFKCADWYEVGVSSNDRLECRVCVLRRMGKVGLPMQCHAKRYAGIKSGLAVSGELGTLVGCNLHVHVRGSLRYITDNQATKQVADQITKIEGISGVGELMEGSFDVSISL